jgi:hypothetical protein
MTWRPRDGNDVLDGSAAAISINADLVDEDVRDAVCELGLGRIAATGSNT